MFFKKLYVYCLFLLIVTSCAGTKSDLNLHTQKQFKGPVEILEVLSQDQYDYKLQHQSRIDRAIGYYQKILNDYPGKFKKIQARGLIIGKRYSVVKDLRFRLNQEGIDLPNLNSSLYDLDVYTAIKLFQKNHGIKETGLIDVKTEEALNIDLETKINYLKQSKKNIELLPNSFSNKYIVVNIPAYKMYAFRRDHYIKNIDVIVGTVEHKTPTLINANLTNIYFNPSWVVPPALLYTVILDKLIADSKAMQNDGFEAYAYDKINKKYIEQDITSISWKKYSKNYFPFVIKMKPGKNNPMGKIKFEFVNNQSITIHGTIDHELFTSEATRASSVGCIRLKDEFALAEFILEDKKEWNLAKILSLYNAISENSLTKNYNQRVIVDQKIPVNIIYHNAWVDDSGFVNFREDIYSSMT